MRSFAHLLDSLSTSQSRTAKLRLMSDYFRATPDPDRGWALAALSDGLDVSVPIRRVLSGLMADKIDPVLYKLSRDYVGDTAETAALLWPDQQTNAPPPALCVIVDRIKAAQGTAALSREIGSLLDVMTVRERWAFLKLISGAPRVGVSARLTKTALAEMSGKAVSEIEEVWHSLTQPYVSLFAWLEGRGPRPDPAGKPVFRPMMLANPIEDRDWAELSADEIAAEWKWDGIRVQAVMQGSDVRLYSRTGDDISSSFPDLTGALGHLDAVADGELLVVRDGSVQPFNDLQQRLNRKTVTSKMMRDFPVHLRLYDLLFETSADLRNLPFRDRRERLESWHSKSKPPRTDLSALIAFRDLTHLKDIWSGTRDGAIEGLMLKRWSSPYLAGRPKGHWYKWKRAALTVDCVLMYAQRGSGKRSSFYSDYTFGAWKTGDDGTRSLVPVGKAYSGFTDVELKQLDTFIRANTTESFGPVRAVAQKLVFEVAFDAVQNSNRHKSGVAMRFPRIHRIRWDKPAVEADTLEAIIALI